MLGIGDFTIVAAYFFLIGSTLLSVIYTAVMWKKEGEVSKEELLKEVEWKKGDNE